MVKPNLYLTQASLTQISVVNKIQEANHTTQYCTTLGS